MTHTAVLQALILFIQQNIEKLEYEEAGYNQIKLKLKVEDVEDDDVEEIPRTETYHKIEPFLDKISEVFDKYISLHGAYIGPMKFNVLDQDGETIEVRVGPGETDGFGWLTGKISCIIPTKVGQHHFKTHFG